MGLGQHATSHAQRCIVETDQLNYSLYRVPRGMALTSSDSRMAVQNGDQEVMVHASTSGPPPQTTVMPMV